MRRPILIAAASLMAALGAGCGSSESSTPAACLRGPGTYLKALAAAPARVTLGDGVAISDCLVENQPPGELASVGSAMVTAATRLNAAARRAPGGDANLQLGYLVGAAQRGGESTSGIHTDLVRRLSAAAGYSRGGRPLPGAFGATYRRGFDAGHRSG